MDCVRKTQDVAKALADKNWELAVQLRGKSFKVWLAKVHPGANVTNLFYGRNLWIFV